MCKHEWGSHLRAHEQLTCGRTTEEQFSPSRSQHQLPIDLQGGGKPGRAPSPLRSPAEILGHSAL